MNLTKGIYIRLTEADYQYMEEQAKADPAFAFKNGNPNVSAYCRNVLLQNTNRKNVSIQKSVDALAYQVRKIGNNINQITKAINAGYRFEGDLARIEELMERLDVAVRHYIEETETLWESQN